jgi:hypothetical protein
MQSREDFVALSSIVILAGLLAGADHGGQDVVMLSISYAKALADGLGLGTSTIEQGVQHE